MGSIYENPDKLYFFGFVSFCIFSLIRDFAGRFDKYFHAAMHRFRAFPTFLFEFRYFLYKYRDEEWKMWGKYFRGINFPPDPIMQGISNIKIEPVHFIPIWGYENIFDTREWEFPTDGFKFSSENRNGIKFSN